MNIVIVLSSSDGNYHHSPSVSFLQVEAGSSASHLKFTIRSGHDHFVSIHRVNVDGASVTS